MHGTLRISAFLLGVIVLPLFLIIVPLYLRHRVYAETAFAVTESDVLKVDDGISSIFCQAHILKMNTSFNAFQVQKDSPRSDQKHRKHIKLYKNMKLPDDSLEYWGFFLTQDSTVNLSICSRYSGGRIMVVKDSKDFHTCGLLQRDKKRIEEAHVSRAQDVHILYQSNNSVRNSGENTDQTEGEDMSIESMDELKKYAEMYFHKHINPKFLQPKNNRSNNTTNEKLTDSKNIRGNSNYLNFRLNDKASDDTNLQSNKYDTRKNLNLENLQRDKRSIDITHKEGVLHGKTENDTDDSDVSSFENTLIECHDGRILLSSNFTSTHHCTDVTYLEMGKHLQIEHKVHTDGYYYYIFYSDNDYLINNIHVIFNIYKPTYEYGNYSKACINETECKFPISFLSNEEVVVEIPMRDGIMHEPDEITILTSTCEPRLLIYAIFPITLIVTIFFISFL